MESVGRLASFQTESTALTSVTLRVLDAQVHHRSVTGLSQWRELAPFGVWHAAHRSTSDDTFPLH